MCAKREEAQFCAPGCPVEFVASLLGGRWKSVILYQLRHGPVRFGQLRRYIPGVTQRMLTLQLRELESDGLITRTIYPEVPPRVDYRLTALGESLQSLILEMLKWGENHQNEVVRFREQGPNPPESLS